jgi:hypothetical protein
MTRNWRGSSSVRPSIFENYKTNTKTLKIRHCSIFQAQKLNQTFLYLKVIRKPDIRDESMALIV